MSLKLMYITNDPEIAKIAEKHGCDRIFLDLETIGKEERQRGMNTVKSHHHLSDVPILRKVLTKSELLVRVNPLYDGTQKELDSVIKDGADIVMLPMFRTADDARRFVKMVNGRCKVMLLAETKDAMENLEEICQVPGIDEIHIGLNDLHLELHKQFMFELLADGTVDRMAAILKKHHITFGFGGIARLDEGMLPARHIIGDHYRLGSTIAILSRSFCDSWIIDDLEEIDRVFKYGLMEIREYEERLTHESKDFFENNHLLVQREVADVLLKKNGK